MTKRKAGQNTSNVRKSQITNLNRTLFSDSLQKKKKCSQITNKTETKNLLKRFMKLNLLTKKKSESDKNHIKYY